MASQVARQCAAEADKVANARNKLDRWVPVTTANHLSSDVMRCHGAIAKPNEIPIGTSYDHSGIRVDNHDTVAAILVVPFKDIAAGGPSGITGAQQAQTEAEEAALAVTAVFAQV